MQIRYSYEDCPTIQAFSECTKQVRGLMGAFGSGKSSGCVVEMIRVAQQQAPGIDGIRRTRWAVVRNTYSQLEDTSLKTVMDWMPPQFFGRYNKAEHTYYVTGFEDVEIEIMFRALDRPDHVKKLLSLELTGAWVNEAREVPYTIIKSLLGRTGRYPAVKDGGCTWHGLIMDTNPPDSDSWWYKLFEIDRPANCALFKQPSGLSPEAENISNLIDGYYQSQYELNKSDPEWVKVYVHGEYGFVIDGKPVYPEYKDSTHCREVDVVPGIPIKRGWDFGLTPCAILLQQLANGRVIVIDEIISEDMGIDRLSDQVLDYCAEKYQNYTFEDYGDPAGLARSQTDERSCFDIMRAKGINIQPGQQNLTIRLESVKKLLNMLVDGEPGLLISPLCKMLRKGMQGGYQYRRLQVSGDRYTEKPDKNQYSHSQDAFQYVCSVLFGGSLQAKSGKKFDYLDFYG